MTSTHASPLPAVPPAVPWPIVLYTALGVTDYGFTLAAFVHGAREANPALKWFADQGLFEFAKLSLTLLVCCVAAYIWHVPITRRALALGNVLMSGVVVYHVAIMVARMHAL